MYATITARLSPKTKYREMKDSEGVLTLSMFLESVLFSLIYSCVTDGTVLLIVLFYLFFL